MPTWLIILIGVLVALAIIVLWPKVFDVDFKGGDGGKHYAAQYALLR